MSKKKNNAPALKPLALCIAVITLLALSGCGGGGDTANNGGQGATGTTKSVTVISGKA